MKKHIITVLLGIMLLGLVSCGNKNTREFNETKTILDKYEAAIDNAKSCDEVNSAQDNYYQSLDEFRKTPKYPGKDQMIFDDKDRMSDEEIDLYSQLWVQVEKKYSEKKKELCE